jgi:hypothetical protein
VELLVQRPAELAELAVKQVLPRVIRLLSVPPVALAAVYQHPVLV